MSDLFQILDRFSFNKKKYQYIHINKKINTLSVSEYMDRKYDNGQWTYIKEIPRYKHRKYTDPYNELLRDTSNYIDVFIKKETFLIDGKSLNLTFELGKMEILDDKIIFFNFILLHLFDKTYLRKDLKTSLAKISNEVLAGMIISLYENHKILGIEMNSFTKKTIYKQKKKSKIDLLFNLFGMFEAIKAEV